MAVIAEGTRITTLEEIVGVFNMNETMSVENGEVVGVRATEEVIVPGVGGATCML